MINRSTAERDWFVFFTAYTPTVGYLNMFSIARNFPFVFSFFGGGDEYCINILWGGDNDDFIPDTSPTI